MMAKVMPRYREMLGPWFQLVNVGHLQCTTIVFECLAMDLRLSFLEFETLSPHFPNYLLQVDDFPLRATDRLMFFLDSVVDNATCVCILAFHMIGQPA